MCALRAHLSPINERESHKWDSRREKNMTQAEAMKAIERRITQQVKIDTWLLFELDNILTDIIDDTNTSEELRARAARAEYKIDNKIGDTIKRACYGYIMHCDNRQRHELMRQVLDIYSAREAFQAMDDIAFNAANGG